MRTISTIRKIMSLMAIAIAFAGNSRASAALVEMVCITAKQASYVGESIACYSDTGCSQAEAMGGDAILNYDVQSAPYALARGKIAAIITTSPQLIEKIRTVGGKCTKLN